MAVPRGLGWLARTRGTKRWLLPPFAMAAALLALALWLVFDAVGGWRAENLPTGVDWRDADWLRRLADDWAWLHAVLLWLVVPAEWLAELCLSLLGSSTLSYLAGFLIASLVVWYCFSIAYEAVAGPFLDEIQGRLEARWFGADPRSQLERPNDLPVATCTRISLGAALAGVALAALVQFQSAWLALPALAAPFVVAGLVHRRYGAWLAWIARIEGGALWVGLQASMVTGVILLLALPLYFVPVLGYFLFAGVTGFATAVTLLDIATERRGWTLRQRLGFVRRHFPALVAFGSVAGALLAVPFVGPVLMVPSASVGGLWLLCRIDKNFMRPGGSPAQRWASEAAGSGKERPPAAGPVDVAPGGE